MTRRSFYRLAVVLPLIGFVAAAAIRTYFGWEREASAFPGSRTESVYPPSLLRDVVAYLGVVIWAWRPVIRAPLPQVARLLWQAPLLFLGLHGVLVGIFAVVQERGLASLAEERSLLVVRGVAYLVLSYIYVALIQWAAQRVSDPSTWPGDPRSTGA
ncbi:MAG: hypothetical protein ACREOC_06305 [Gemmatimonadales bacterium]